MRPGLRFLDLAPVRRPRAGWAGLLLLLAGSVLAGSCLNPHADDGTNSVFESSGDEENATSLGPSGVAERNPNTTPATPAPQLPGGANAGAPPAATAAPEARPMGGDSSADAGTAPADAGDPDAAIPANAL